MKWAKITPVPVCVKDGKAEIQCEGIGKGDIVVLAVHGPDVSSRIINESDPLLRRIFHNETLLWTRGSEEVFYVPREVVEKSLGALNGAHVADTIVCGPNENVKRLAAARIAQLGELKNITANRSLFDCVAGQWYQRLRLPLLLFWLVLLALNYFISSDLGRRISEAQVQSRFNQQVTEQAAAVSAQQERMTAEYKTLALPASSPALDYVASILPGGMTLSKLTATRSALNLKGNADAVQSVVAFARDLSDASWAVEIRSIDESPEGKQYRFELVLTR